MAVPVATVVMPGLVPAMTQLYAGSTEVGRQFDAIRAKDGLKAALKWRRDQFLEE
jgi:hypothetical protein